MRNREHTVTCQVTALPDQCHSDYQAISGGNVTSAISDSFEHLARTIGNMSFDSVTVQFIFFHDRTLDIYIRRMCAVSSIWIERAPWSVGPKE